MLLQKTQWCFTEELQYFYSSVGENKYTKLQNNWFCKIHKVQCFILENLATIKTKGIQATLFYINAKITQATEKGP